MRGFDMNKILSMLIAVIIFSSMQVSAAGEGGINTEPELNETGVESINHDDVAIENQPWSFSITLEDGAIENGTTVQKVTTQICVNQGLCLPPESMELTREENTWSGVITPHWADCTYSELECMITYVNWKFVLVDGEENETKFPENGYYTTWSTCWIYEGVTEGKDCPQEDDSGLLPGFGVTIGVVSLIAASLTQRKMVRVTDE